MGKNVSFAEWIFFSHGHCSLVLQYDVWKPKGLGGDAELFCYVLISVRPGWPVPSQSVVTPLLYPQILWVWQCLINVFVLITEQLGQRCQRVPVLSRRLWSEPPSFHSVGAYFDFWFSGNDWLIISGEKCSYQRDEVGQGHLNVHLSDVATPLHGSYVLVVSGHQIFEELSFEVYCRCWGVTKIKALCHFMYTRRLSWVFIKYKTYLEIRLSNDSSIFERSKRKQLKENNTCFNNKQVPCYPSHCVKSRDARLFQVLICK